MHHMTLKPDPIYYSLLGYRVATAGGYSLLSTFQSQSQVGRNTHKVDIKFTHLSIKKTYQIRTARWPQSCRWQTSVSGHHSS